MGGFSFPRPAESKQKLFTFDDNGPSLILILPNSSDIAMLGSLQNLFTVSVIPFRISSSDGG